MQSFAHSVFFLLQAKSARTTSNSFFSPLPLLLYFLILCVVPASPLRGVSLGKFMSLVLFTLCT